MFRRVAHLVLGLVVAGAVAFAPLSSALAERSWQCAPFARLVS
ncbi:MAG: CHAP domain-containing protein, partial [Phenylobacterium sp.]|nr:CHAP domain-containing protein [Phenylobacterium sp.]